MKLTLPLTIASIPIAAESLEVWRDLQPKFSAIALAERRDEDLYPSERTAYNAIAYAQHLASRKQWDELWTYLVDRKILRVSKAIAAPPAQKPPRKPRSPSSPHPTNPPQAEQSKKRKARVLTYFAQLKPFLIRLYTFLWFGDFCAVTAPLCHGKTPIAKRPDGYRVKALLSYSTNNGEYSSLKIYLPSAKARYKMHPNALALLEKNRREYQQANNLYRVRSRKKIESDRLKGQFARLVSKEQLDRALTNKWQDAGAIAVRLNEILDTPISRIQVSKLLDARFRKGEVCQCDRGFSEIAYYSLVQATEFESHWLTLEMAYQLAISRGCAIAKNSFRKNQLIDYSRWGLEFRREVPENENRLLRWRDVKQA